MYMGRSENGKFGLKYSEGQSGVIHVRQPEPLEISTGNPAHSWVKLKFEIYMKEIKTSWVAIDYKPYQLGNLL